MIINRFQRNYKMCHKLWIGQPQFDYEKKKKEKMVDIVTITVIFFFIIPIYFRISPVKR